MAPMTPPTTARELTLPPDIAEAVRPLVVSLLVVGTGVGTGSAGAIR